jgi:D-alanine-D-alanine ligase-like ATP-grasp enzyme
MPHSTPSFFVGLSNNKLLTNLYLKENNLPTTISEDYKDLASAHRFLKKYKKIVIKPKFGIQGKGITVGITDVSKIKKAADFAKKHDKQKKVLLEKYYEGDTIRILVVGFKKVFAIKKMTPMIKGDGNNNINSLIKAYNSRICFSFPVMKSRSLKELLLSQNKNFHSIPDKNEVVFLGLTANVKNGGSTEDVTAILNKKIKKEAIKISKLYKAPLVGMDFLSRDPSKPEGVFLEVEITPGIGGHHFPCKGPSYNIAKELLQHLFFTN